MKKLLIAILVVVVVASAGLFFWARSVFTHDTVRTTLAAELSEALGQPVTVGSISATIYPRVTVKLGEVTIGEPAGIRIASLNVGTDFRALLSRRIEHASARVEGAKIQLPLMPLGNASSTPAAPPPDTAQPTGSPVELVSIDEIVLSDVELVSGGRTLRGDIEVVPESGGAVTLRRVSLNADDASIEATGRITDLAGPTGDLAIKAGELNFDRLMAFFNDFVATPTTGDVRAREASTGKPNLTVSIEATRAQMAALTVEALSARAQVTEAGVVLKPIAFNLFGGKYDGALAIKATGSGAAPVFLVASNVTNIDLSAVTRFAGSAADAITGRLSGQLELTGTGADAAAALHSMRGTARVNIVDGIVRNLGLVRAIVVATSMRGEAASFAGASAAATTQAKESRDEPFKTVTATLSIAGRNATTNDLRFEGTNVSLGAAGSVALDGSAINLTGRVQLSEELTTRAGTDLVRYTRENGRVTLPVNIKGPAAAMSVQIDVGDVMKRAIRNRAEEEAQKAIIKGLGGLFKKPK